MSRFRLAEQLKAHYVPEDIIEETLSGVPDGTELENARALVAKFMRQLANLEDGDEKRRRVYARLKTRGYSHETIMSAMSEDDI